MPARPFTRRQAAENARFLAALAETGNARLAARSLGVHRATYTKRRARSAAFATSWDAALAAAHARFKLAGGERPPEAGVPPRAKRGEGAWAFGCPRQPKIVSGGHDLAPTRPKDGGGARSEAERGQRQDTRTRGGEPMVVRLRNGRLQLRLAPPGWMTKASEQAFFFAISASANVRLAAAAAGFAHSTFYRRRRRAPAFAREMRLSLKIGWERLEGVAIASALPESWEDDGWRQCHPPQVVPMSFDQLLQLLHLHDRSVNQGWDMPHRRKRRGEPWETYTQRLGAMWRVEQHRVAERDALGGDGRLAPRRRTAPAPRFAAAGAGHRLEQGREGQGPPQPGPGAVRGVAAK
jgi:hypothetical protein